MAHRVRRKHVLILSATLVPAALILTVIGATREIAVSDANRDLKSSSGEMVKQEFTSRVGTQDVNNSGVAAFPSVTHEELNTAVIIGTALSNKCRLSSDGEEVMTYYEVQVDEVRGGNLPVGSKITVSTLGGLVLLKQNGTEVNERNKLTKNTEVIVEMPEGRVQMEGVASTKFTPPEFDQPMLNGKRYLLTLVGDPKEKKFKLAASPEELK